MEGCSTDEALQEVKQKFWPTYKVSLFVYHLKLLQRFVIVHVRNHSFFVHTDRLDSLATSTSH